MTYTLEEILKTANYTLEQLPEDVQKYVSEKQKLIANYQNLLKSSRVAKNPDNVKKFEGQIKEAQELICEKVIAALPDNSESEAEKERDSLYKNTIEKADAAFSAQQFDEAKNLYSQALEIKPSEEFPATQIAAIDNLLSEKAAADQKEIDDSFNATIEKADAAFSAEQFDEAKNLYSQALTIKPAEEYPTTQIAAIDKILSEKAIEEEKTAAFKKTPAGKRAERKANRKKKKQLPKRSILDILFKVKTPKTE